MVKGGQYGSDPYDYRWQQFSGTTPWTGDGSGSNAGACVSIYAPAGEIRAARTEFTSGATAYGSASGTSFSSPIVAGIAARYMERQKNQTGVTPTASQVYTWLLNNAGATVHAVDTPAYYICTELTHEWTDTTQDNRVRLDKSWLDGVPRPAECRSAVGEEPSWVGLGKSNSVWQYGAPPVWFPSVGNASAARMVYWDEGPCP